MRFVNPLATLPDDAYARGADLARALAHPVRLHIVAGLLDGTCSVGPMTECLGLPQPLVSRHLAILRDAGVVAATADGRERHYEVVHPDAPALAALLLGRPVASHPSEPVPRARRETSTIP